MHLSPSIDPGNPFVRGFFDVWKVPTRRTVTGWADDKRMLPSKGAAEPGKYRSARTPYMREPMDCLSVLSPVEEVVVMAAAQTGKSESGNNWVGYVIDEAPGPMLLVQPTVDNAKRYSKQRIAPMILETPSLTSKVVANKSREGGNTMLEKEFPGGILILGGANSAAGLRSMPIRYLFADEISNWPLDVDGEGDPLGLAEERTNTFGRKRKIFKTSTPGIRDVCRIEAEYKKTDQRRYFVPCPHCGHKHVLEWKNFVIPKDANGKPQHRQAHMVCPDCGGVIEERHKTDLLNGGEWIATAPENEAPEHRGYHISALYSPIGWKSWAKVAKQWIEAQGFPKKLQAFVNNVLAETWEEAFSAKLDANSLANRAEAYDLFTAPAGVLVVTAGVDVQVNRIEVQHVGWGADEEAWVLGYSTVFGDPTDFATWAQVWDVIQMPIRHASGVVLRAVATAVDSGDGNTTNEVYAFTRQHRKEHVFAVKGMAGAKPVIGAPRKQDINIRGQKIEKGAVLYTVGVDSIKSTVYGRLKRTETSGAGVVHFPLGMATLNPEYYKQLTAEKKQQKLLRGFPKWYWTKADGDANEALDTFNYAYAGLHYWISRHNPRTFWSQMAKRLEKLKTAQVESPPTTGSTPDPVRAAEVPATKPASKLSGWKR